MLFHTQADTDVLSLFHLHFLAEQFIGLFPFWPRRHLEPLLFLQLCKIQLADSGLQIHVAAVHDRRLEVDFIRNKTQQDNRNGEIGLEEVFYLRCSALGWRTPVRCRGREPDPELCYQR